MSDKRRFPSSDDERSLSRLGWVVDTGFFALILACAIRYYSIHPFTGLGVVVLVLAVGSSLSYLTSVVGAPSAALKRAGVLLATALWFPLVLLAPSFGWAAFALFFAVHRVLPRRAAQWLSAAIVIAVCVGMYVLSGGQDLGLTFGPLLGGIVLSVVYVQLDRVSDNRRRLIEELVLTQQQLARTEREAGALFERTRVANELHDTVAQQTATALMLLESVDHQTPPVIQARNVLREALTDTRQLMAGLTQPQTSGESLSSALATLATARGADFVLAGEERSPSDEISHALLRVCQEALTNVDKHAHATRVSVTLTFFGDAIGVDVADDGVGFELHEATDQRDDPTPAQNGYGLRAMAWRVESLGGTFRIESVPHEGTVIAAVIPDVTVQRGSHDPNFAR